MKLTVLLLASVMLAASSCQTGGVAQNSAVGTAVTPAAASASFYDVMDRDWVLSEVISDSRAITLDRGRLAGSGSRDIFTLRFDGERASGTGAPNRFFGPYAVGYNQTITIGSSGMVASTRMAPIFELEELAEHEFFGYLGSAFEWNLFDGNLELRTANEDGAEVLLVFVLLDWTCSGTP